MLFLRLTLLAIIILGAMAYLIRAKIWAEFQNRGGTAQGFFRGQSEGYKAFCHNPPTPDIARLLERKRKFSIALAVAVVSFLLAILSVAL